MAADYVKEDSMAKATVQTREVVEITGVTLTLTRDEALILQYILGLKVTGSSAIAARNHASSIWEALDQAGIIPPLDGTIKITGSLHFEKAEE
jgi:hypothetical protein